MYAYKNGCEWNKDTCDNAAKNGHLECLVYAHKNGCPLGEDTCFYAAINGHLECLKYAHKNGGFLDNVCEGAVENGHLDCLKYAHENGFPWDEYTTKFAARSGHFDCLKYAYENGCPYPEELKSIIVRKIIIPKWYASVKVHFIIYYWIERSAKASCAENGRVRIEDINSFENDFNNLLV